MPEHKIRILHISDIHLRGEGEREVWRRRHVLGKAWERNLEELLTKGPINLVCLTGDIANTGRPDEYQQASDFVGALRDRIGLDPRHIFIVPGNHDINRTVSKVAWSALRRHLPKADPLDISRWFAGGRCPNVRGLRDAHRDTVFMRQKAYRDWIRGPLGRPDLLPENSPHKLLGYRSTLNLPGYPFSIHVIGLDSAWLAGDDSDAENLRLTDDQVMRLATDQEGNPLSGFRLALVHHPLHSLADHSQCQRLLSAHVDLLLRGHLHEQDVARELRPDQELIQLAAGCLYEGARANAYPNSCQLIELTVDPTGRPKQLALHFRSWSARGHWHDDSSLYKEAPNGHLRWIMERTAKADRWITADAEKSAPIPSASVPGNESLLDGMRTLESGRQVRKFLSAYIGTQEHPEPFGGRDVELKALNDWLNSAESPCMVLSAPAGCGKSALLCRFCLALLPRTDLAIVFFPISIRYQTNLESGCIPAIVSRLSHLHGEPAPRLEHTSPDQWRNLLDQYLCRPLSDGRTLLLIIDGLDEAGDWQPDRTLFPNRLPDRVRILASARYRIGDTSPDAWRHRLGWEHPTLSTGLTLSGLEVDGVAEAVASLGMPLGQLTDKSEIIVQIHRLSRGEPLLVQLWCHRLWKQGEGVLSLTPEQLSGYPDGLKGYMQEFWDSRKQTEKDSLRRQADSQLVLEILASALGPIKREELLILAPEVGSLSAFQDALEPLSRFVIGDGKTQGYVLSHSLLRDYFRDEMMTEAGRQERDQRFLAYGQETLKGMAGNSERGYVVPEYPLRYYGSHLQNCGSPPDQFLDLVNDTWRRAWQKVENGAGGFLQDVSRAWDAVERDEAQRSRKGEAPRRLASIVRCAMCVSGVKSIFDGIYFQLPILLVEKKMWSVGQALAYAQQMSDEGMRSDARHAILVFLTPRLPEALLPRLLDILLDQANSMRGSVEVLLTLTERLAKSCPHEAIAAARGLRREQQRSMVLASLAHHLPPERSASLFAESLHLARECSHPYSRSAWLERLCPYLPESQRQEVLKESVEAASQVEDAQDRATRWRSLIPLLPKRGRARIEALDDLFDAACQSPPERSTLALALEVLDIFTKQTQRRVLRRVSLLPHGNAAILHWVFSNCRLHTFGEQIPDPKHRWRILQELKSTDELAAILQPTIDGLHGNDPWHSLRLLSDLGPFLSRNQKDAVVALLCTASNPWLTARGLCWLSPYLDPQWRLDAFSRLVGLSWRKDYSGDHDLQIIVSSLAVEQLDAAAEIAANASCATGKTWACFILALRLQHGSQIALLAKAKDAALQIPSPTKRAQLLRTMLPYHPPDQQQELLSETYQAICAIRSGQTRIQELRHLAQLLNQPFLDRLLRLALDEVPNLEPDIRAASVLEDILRTRGISDEMRSHVLVEALHAARKSRSARDRELTLTDLSQFAPDAQQPSILLEALEASQRLDDLSSQITTIAALQPDVSMQRRLITLCAEFEPEARLRTLYYIIWPHAEPSLRPEIIIAGIAATRDLPSNNPGRVSYMANWLALVPKEERKALAREALGEAHKLLDEYRELLWSEDSQADKDDSRARRDAAQVLLHSLPMLFGELDSEEVLTISALVPPTWLIVHAGALPHTPEPRRSELARQYLAEARSQPERDRGLALADVAVNLDPEERAAGIHEALREARIIYSSQNTFHDNREPIMRRVAPFLQAEHLAAFNKLLAERCREEKHVFMSAATLLDAVPEAFRKLVVENLLQHMKEWSAHFQDRVLAASADHLSEEWYERVASALPRIIDQWTARPVSALVPRLSDRLLRQILGATLTANGELAPGDAQLRAFALVGTELLGRSASSLSEVVPVVTTMIRRRVDNRSAFLTALEHMAPLLRKLVGKSGVTAISETILEVGSWWL